MMKTVLQRLPFASCWVLFLAVFLSSVVLGTADSETGRSLFVYNASVSDSPRRDDVVIREGVPFIQIKGCEVKIEGEVISALVPAGTGGQWKECPTAAEWDSAYFSDRIVLVVSRKAKRAALFDLNRKMLSVGKRQPCWVEVGFEMITVEGRVNVSLEGAVAAVIGHTSAFVYDADLGDKADWSECTWVGPAMWPNSITGSRATSANRFRSDLVLVTDRNGSAWTYDVARPVGKQWVRCPCNEKKDWAVVGVGSSLGAMFPAKGYIWVYDSKEKSASSAWHKSPVKEEWQCSLNIGIDTLLVESSTARYRYLSTENRGGVWQRAKKSDPYKWEAFDNISCLSVEPMETIRRKNGLASVCSVQPPFDFVHVASK